MPLPGFPGSVTGQRPQETVGARPGTSAIHEEFSGNFHETVTRPRLEGRRLADAAGVHREECRRTPEPPRIRGTRGSLAIR